MVVFAQSTEDVVIAVNVSRKYRVPIIAYSGTTSLERNHVAASVPDIDSIESTI